jgi:hypothetical protein
MENEYIDESELDVVAGKVTLAIQDDNLDISEDERLERMINHVTNTKKYDTTKLEIISPETVMKENETHEKDNPNPEFTDALKELTKIYKRPLTKNEYIKACDSYATILAEKDEEKKKNYDGKYIINPINKERYLRLLLENKPVTNAFRESMQEYENVMVNSVLEAYGRAKENELKVLEIKPEKRVNVRYKGKCRIASDQSGKVVIIDNKNDVNLLRMKYRKEWIDKKYPDEFNPKMIRPDGEDEFV